MLGHGRRRQERLAALDAFRHVRKAANEDITRFGEELGELHLETLTTSLDESMRTDYQRALDAYEAAKTRLGAAEGAEEVTEVTRLLADGRFAHACVLAARDDVPRPHRRDPCFFDPGHGPAERDVEWAPAGGVPREVPVCFRDYERLAVGDQPEVRLVRLGNRRVPWFASGPLYTAWAQGWYSDLAEHNRLERDRLTMLYSGTVMPGAAAGALGPVWTDPGAWQDGGLIGGHDFTGYDGSGFGGGGDFGGGDVGGDGGGGGGDGGG